MRHRAHRVREPDFVRARGPKVSTSLFSWAWAPGQPPPDTEVDVHQPSDYTLSLRIEADSIDFDALDTALGVVGTRQHVDRRPTRFLSGLNLDRWELEACDNGSWNFDSIGEAFSAMGGEVLAPAVGNLATADGPEAYWWCGCFHTASSALTLISKRTLELLGRSHAPIILDTYYSPEHSDDSGPSLKEGPNEYGGHRYRFRLSDGESCLPGDEWGPYYEDFGEGLELQIRELTTLMPPDGVRVGAIKRVVCEHVQDAFDGGPAISAAHAAAIALHGLDLEIIWRIVE